MSVPVAGARCTSGPAPSVRLGEGPRPLSLCLCHLGSTSCLWGLWFSWPWGRTWGQVVVTLFQEVGMVTVLFPVVPGHLRLDPRRPFCAIGWVLTRCPLACVARGVWPPWMRVVGLWAARDRRGGRGPFPLEPSARACAPAPVHLECLRCGAASGLWRPRAAAGEASEVLYHRAPSPPWAPLRAIVTTPVSMAPCRVSGVPRSVSSAALPGGRGW